MAREGENFPAFTVGQPTTEKLLGSTRPGSGLIKASTQLGRTPRVPGLTKIPKPKLTKIPVPKIPRRVTN